MPPSTNHQFNGRSCTTAIHCLCVSVWECVLVCLLFFLSVESLWLKFKYDAHKKKNRQQLCALLWHLNIFSIAPFFFRRWPSKARQTSSPSVVVEPNILYATQQYFNKMWLRCGKLQFHCCFIIIFWMLVYFHNSFLVASMCVRAACVPVCGWVFVWILNLVHVLKTRFLFLLLTIKCILLMDGL